MPRWTKNLREERRKALVIAVRDHIATYHRPPSHYELAETLGVSTKAVRDDIRILEEAGILMRDPAIRRSLQLTPAANSIRSSSYEPDSMPAAS